MLLITGANGQLGRLIVESVQERDPNANFAVSVRDPQSAAELAEKGIEIRRADYDDLSSVRAAFEGIDRLLLMPTPTPDPSARVEQMRPVIAAAAEAGIGHIVYPGAAEVPGLDFPLLSAHAEIFRAIAATGMAATEVRVGIYAEVIAREVEGAIAAGELAAPVGDARVAPVLRSDIAAAIARILTDESGHEGLAYDFTGRDSVSWDDLAGLASERSGKVIAYRPIDDDEAEARLRAAGIPAEYIPSMIGFYGAYRAGWSGTPSGDIERLAGRPPRPTIQAINAVLDGTDK